jgi:hypothetical protein
MPFWLVLKVTVLVLEVTVSVLKVAVSVLVLVSEVTVFKCLGLDLGAHCLDLGLGVTALVPSLLLARVSTHVQASGSARLTSFVQCGDNGTHYTASAFQAKNGEKHNRDI